MLNLLLIYFILLGINHSLETSIIKESKCKGKTKKKKTTHKFMSLGKDQTVSILHGVGRVLNPKGKFTMLYIYHTFYYSGTKKITTLCLDVSNTITYESY